MLDRLSVPRRPLDFEDYVDIVRRNFRWILAPAFLGLVIGTVVAYVMEDTYVSTALIRIVPQQIPDSMVQNASSQQLADHINAMAETILSRNTLTNLINNYHLYQQDLKSEPLEDVINHMKTSAITIRPTLGIANVASASTGKTLPAMQISFTYRDRFVAKSVCDDLVSRFMSQNTQETLENQEAANQFFEDEFQRAKRELDTVDGKLAAYRSRNAGRLPEQLELNVQQMNALSQRGTALNDSLNRSNEQRMLLESAIRIAKDRLAALKDVTPQSQVRNERVIDLDKQIQTLQTNIEDMRNRYTESFPDLQNARQQLAILERQREQAVKEKPARSEATPSFENPALARERLDLQSQIDGLQSQMKANEAEGQQITKELASVNGQVKTYQNRIQGVPAGEREYAELMHDRELAKQHYDELELKRQKSVISMDMHRRKQGETLEVLDAASLPVAPSAPKRPVIIGAGPGIGLIIGLIIVAVREVKDASLKNLKDARLYTQLTILGSVPLLENDLIVQRRKQIMWVGWAAGTLVGLAIMAGSIAHYYLGKA
jgi:polysaccharide biosynthesis transport protein